jgi:hypothetical protein
MSLRTWDRPHFKERGQHVTERLERKAATKAAERAEKLKVRLRDLPCRWPRCEHVRKGYRPEVAHLDNKKMGGDHGLRTSAELMMQLCYWHHQGPRSLHTGHGRVEYLTPAKADGPCAFYALDESDREYMVARELAVNGPYEARD